MIQAAIITLVAVPFGFELFPAHIALGLLLLGLFGVGVGSLSYALAIAARKNEWVFWAVQQTLLFPLLILSGMMLPLDTGPEWMQVLSKLNPLTYMVEAERVLFTGSLGIEVLWGAVAACADGGDRAVGGHPLGDPDRLLARGRGFGSIQRFPSYSESEQRSPPWSAISLNASLLRPSACSGSSSVGAAPRSSQRTSSASTASPSPSG